MGRLEGGAGGGRGEEVERVEVGEGAGGGGGGGGRRLGACALAQHVPAAQSLLLSFLLQAVLQQPQLPLHRLPHGRLHNRITPLPH